MIRFPARSVYYGRSRLPHIALFNRIQPQSCSTSAISLPPPAPGSPIPLQAIFIGHRLSMRTRYTYDVHVLMSRSSRLLFMPGLLTPVVRTVSHVVAVLVAL